MSFKKSAHQILSESNEPLHYQEITDRAIQKGILQTTGKTPSSTMNAQLITDINSKGTHSRFIKTGPGTFGLNPDYKERESTSGKPKKKQKSVKESVGSGFTGKGGEHYVTSELLFRGYNASIMSVDLGMDIIATKNNNLFSLQVKTANLTKNGNSFIFDMRKVSLQREYAGNVFYIFVMLEPKGRKSALILPSSKIDELIHRDAIKTLKTLDRFRVNLKIRNGRLYIGTLDNEIGYYWNNWDIIK